MGMNEFEIWLIGGLGGIFGFWLAAFLPTRLRISLRVFLGVTALVLGYHFIPWRVVYSHIVYTLSDIFG